MPSPVPQVSGYRMAYQTRQHVGSILMMEGCGLALADRETISE